MPVEGKKSLPIKAETHKAIARQSVETGKDMYELVDESWNVYEELSRACDQLGLTMEELLRDMYTLFSSAKSETAATRPAQPVAQLPSPLLTLSDDDRWTVENLIQILHARPSSPEYRMLFATLAIAVSEWRKSAGQSAALTAADPDLSDLATMLRDPSDPNAEIAAKALSRWRKEHKPTPKEPAHRAPQKATRTRAVNERR